MCIHRWLSYFLILQSAGVEAEAEISQIELQIEELENKIATGEYTQDIFDEHAKMQKQLEDAMNHWELASIELEKLENEDHSQN